MVHNGKRAVSRAPTGSRRGKSARTRLSRRKLRLKQKRRLEASSWTSTCEVNTGKGVAAASFRSRTRGQGGKKSPGAWYRAWLARGYRGRSIAQTSVDDSFLAVSIENLRFFARFRLFFTLARSRQKSVARLGGSCARGTRGLREREAAGRLAPRQNSVPQFCQCSGDQRCLLSCPPFLRDEGWRLPSACALIFQLQDACFTSNCCVRGLCRCFLPYFSLNPRYRADAR